MKKTLLVVMLLIGISLAWFLLRPEGAIFGADSGALSPGTLADDATVGTIAWSNPTNTTSSNNVYATATHNGGGTTHYLKATNLGFAIPTGATINGIVMEIERSDVQLPSMGINYQTTDSAVKIVKADGSIGTTNKAIAGLWTDSSTETYKTYGSSSDLWGETWTAENINDIDFGTVYSVLLEDDGPTTQKVRVNHIRITVYYTEAGGTPTSVTSDTVFFD